MNPEIRRLQDAYLASLREYGPDSIEAREAQDALIDAKVRLAREEGR